MGFLTNKKILIVGLASNLSIAWGIAKAMKREGAELAFTYQNDKLKSRVVKMAEELGCDTNLIYPCEVTSDDEINAVFAALNQHWDGLDGLVHSVAFAPREALEGNFLDGISRENFAMANDISAYSLVALTKAARPMLEKNQGSVLAMTYLGAVKVIPNYNLMGVAKASLEANVRYLAAALGESGVRVNAISAGPIRTLAASGISGFRKMLEQFEKSAPLRKCVSIDEVGNAAAFLTSDLASGITSEILYVDAGFNTVAMTGLES
ncbi:enoyl-ACP reductase FabI [Ostreibacterium oceani]|uniref:Enoyl-[acyl-carrier-protein] reductase [NADH] n=1 Tax=Ostreibacterium oceani TaxID=2654998 RepID=A0A6N7EZH0_9GAMM|nr:enoyl-ACP reductase [Ostreibacterium oceani]MPV85898.1 SDR family oxidoreductase [Ostreibacterium oceani]